MGRTQSPQLTARCLSKQHGPAGACPVSVTGIEYPRSPRHAPHVLPVGIALTYANTATHGHAVAILLHLHSH